MAENNTKQCEAKSRREKQSDISRRSSRHFCKTGRVFLIAITLIFAIGCMTACKSTPCGNGSNGACKTLREAAETPKTKDKKKTENDQTNKHSSKLLKDTAKEAKKKSSDKSASKNDRPFSASTAGGKKSITGKKAKNKRCCYMTVTCHRIVERWGSIPYSLKKLTPKSGVILVKQKVVLKRGDTAFEVTKRVLKSKRIHFAYQGITQYGTAYVEAINNIYEKDVNSRSGWIYKVNGIAPKVGCSGYTLRNGDELEWAYTCNLGKDL